MARISQETDLTIPIKNILSMILATAVATMAYFNIESRLTSIEYRTDQMLIEVEENDAWIDNFEPPASVQDTIQRVRVLELQVKELEVRLEKNG
jgi:hypothetical protein